MCLPEFDAARPLVITGLPAQFADLRRFRYVAGVDLATLPDRHLVRGSHAEAEHQHAAAGMAHAHHASPGQRTDALHGLDAETPSRCRRMVTASGMASASSVQSSPRATT
jgi:hypothetical protein